MDGLVKPFPEQIYQALRTALNDSLDWTRRNSDASNSLRSARFLSDSCNCLGGLVNPDRKLTARYISVDEKKKRHAGEWLLDGVWTEDATIPGGKTNTERDEVPVRVWCALECESSTNRYEFFKDFSKLLVVSSPLKIFAGGLNQGTESGAEKYVRTRIDEVEELLGALSDKEWETDWYIAFWPSPLNVKGESLWRKLDGDYAHLNEIKLFYRLANMKGGLKGILKNPGCPITNLIEMYFFEVELTILPEG